MKVAYLAGVHPKQIAEQFGLLENTVYTKVAKEKWNLIAKESVSSVEPATKTLESVADLLAEDWKNKGPNHRLHVFKMATEALRKAKLPAPRNWKEANTADLMARRAAGIDDNDRGMTTVVQVGWLDEPISETRSRLEPAIDVAFEPVETDNLTADDGSDDSE